MKFKYIFPTVCFVTALALEVLASSAEAFTIFYVEKVFPVITRPLAFISGLFPFSVGEILIELGAVLLVVAVLVSLVALGFKIIGKKFLKCYKKYMTVVWFLIGVYSLIMVLNCFILYQYPAMKEMTTIKEDDFELLTEIRDRTVIKANELALKMERDEKGQVIGKSREELSSMAIASMKNLSENGYPRLRGFYPRFKYFNDSKFFSKQNMMGYYFPYSMEANVNKIMYSTNFPHSICHELSHLKGYILEDEANFIGYLACVKCDDDLFKYSAMLSVLGYLDNDFYDGIGQNVEEYLKHPVISKLVIEDDIFLTDEMWDIVNGSGVLDTETVKEASKEFTETVLTTNGVSDGMKSYSRVVQLLLDYYSQPENLDNDL